MSAMPTPLYTAEQIRTRVAELAHSLTTRFPMSETTHFVAVLNGSFMFLADLARAMTRPVTVDFVRMTSYGSATTTSGTPRLVHGPSMDLRDRHVVIVEDIVDTGLTLQALREHLLAARPRTLDTVVLLDKPARRRTTVPSTWSASASRTSSWWDTASIVTARTVTSPIWESLRHHSPKRETRCPVPHRAPRLRPRRPRTAGRRPSRMSNRTRSSCADIPSTS